jgi:murein DD-endopeptidase MepM/ murein hydrolase activator NlpD
MIKRLFYKVKYSAILAEYKLVVQEIVRFVSYCLSKKKILILSDNRIISIPISSRLQLSTVLVSVTLMLWVSYTTSKYFAYGDIISEKERELWTTSVTNENLKYQMADLHNNLEDLNKYFSDLEKYGELSDKDKKSPVTSPKGESDEISQIQGTKAHPVNANEDPQREAQRVLFNINNKVKQRISSLEGVISSTGIPLKKIIDKNKPLKLAMEGRKKKILATGQGGPFIPAGDTPYVMDKAVFSSDIRYLLELEKTIHVMPVFSPLKHYYITSRFGKRKDPVRGIAAIHQGLDMVGKKSARVYSSAPGKVAFSGMNGAYGRFVEVNHGLGMSTRYGHLSKLFVKEGDDIKQGQVVGLQGSSGRSTGSHLHYEVRFEGQPLDPYQFLKVGQYVF